MNIDQTSIPGAVEHGIPLTQQEAQEQLELVMRCLAWSMIPSYFIADVFKTPRLQREARRLREVVIEKGYCLMLLLRDGIKDRNVRQDRGWQQEIITFWHSFSVSIQRVASYIETHKPKEGDA